MQITDLKTTIVAVPQKGAPDNFSLAGGTWKVVIIVEVNTDDGLVGLGEAIPTFSDMEFEAAKRLVDSARLLLIGEDPFNVNPIIKKLYVAYNLSHFHIHASSWAWTGVEMALWDLVGKKCGQPLYKIWGGAFRKKIPYFGLIYRTEGTTSEEVANRSIELVKKGFESIFMKVGFDVEEDIELVKVIRETVGYNNGIKIRVDANQAWTPGQAIQVINRLEKYDIEYVDQPVLMYNLDNMARVRSAVNVPISSHESSWTFYDALNLIKRDAADAIHIDPRFDAGFYGARITAGMAEAAGLPVLLHGYSQIGITTCAFMHLAASCPNFMLANQGATYDELLDDVILGGRLEFKDGCLDLPEKPGLGVELDPKKMEKYHAAYNEKVKPKGPPSELPLYKYMPYRNFFK